MSGLCGKRSAADRHTERGEARVKFLVTIAVIGVIAYVAYQYVPVAIRAYQFKDYMQQTVDRASALGQRDEWIKGSLKASFADFSVPPDAVVMTAQRDGRMEARVQFTKQIPLPFYIYQYNFDHTAKSTEMLNIK
ncbi:MAG: hypothetical protein WCF57_13710 [Pyrinomonadaceae bacterium]